MPKFNKTSITLSGGAFFISKLTVPKSRNYGNTGEATPDNKAKCEKGKRMDRKFLENLGLEKETIDKVLDEVSRDIGKHKAQIEAKADELKAANDTIKQMQEAAKAFEGVDINGLKQQLTDAQTKYDTDVNAMKRDFALKLALNGKVHDPADVIRLLDSDKVELDDNGELKGSIDDLIKPIKESKPYLFKENKASGTVKGAKPAAVEQPQTEPGAQTAPVVI